MISKTIGFIWVHNIFRQSHMCVECLGVHGTLAILMICPEDQRQNWFNYFNWSLAADWRLNVSQAHLVGLRWIKEWVVVQHHRSSKCRLEKETGWWFGTWILWLSLCWECHHPHWRSLIFFRGVGRKTTNQEKWVPLPVQESYELELLVLSSCAAAF